MTKKEVVGSFDQISLLVERQSAPKTLEGNRAIIEITSKEIFIGQGGNYKIKWKDVSQLDMDEEGFDLQATKHRVQASGPHPKLWGKCRSFLERCWNKRLEKDRKKEQELEQRQREAKARTYRKTYSKRKSRFDFLNKNESANAWDSEDDDEVFNHQRPKRSRLEDLETAQQEDEEEDEAMEPEESAAELNDPAATDDDETVAGAEQEDPEIEDQQSPAEEDHSPVASPPVERTVNRTTRRRLFRRKQIDDDDSEDDDIFNDNIVTTPHRAQRIVSPPTAGPAILDDDHDEDQDQDDPEEDHAGMKDITNFFKARKGNTTKQDTRNSSRTPPSSTSKTKRQALAMEQTPVPLSQKKPIVSDCFARRKAAAAKQESSIESTPASDVSTVVPTPSSSQLTDIQSKETSVDDSLVNTPKQVKSKFFQNQDPAKNVEEEDPIVDSPSTSSMQKFTPYSAPKRLFRNTYGRRQLTPTSTANMALDLADATSPKQPTLAIRSPLATVSQPTKSRVPSSPVVTPPTKWRGLRNLGNTCYMNASLQMLYSVPDFIRAIETSKDGRHLVSSVARLWHDLQNPKARGSGIPRAIKSNVDSKTNRFFGNQQRDAHEFLGHVIDQLHEELEQPTAKQNSSDNTKDEGEESESPQKEPPATDSFFRLNAEVCLKCKSCGYSRTKEEMYRYLSVDIDSSSDQGGDTQRTIERCIEDFFLPEDREIKCEKCEEGRIATQTMRVLSRPTALLIHLKRFVLVEKEQSENTPENNQENATAGFEMTFRKNKVPVSLSESLSLDPFLSDRTDSAEKEYKLRSIVYHLGSKADSGHYTADAIRRDTEEETETWVSFDDGVCQETSLDQIRESTSNQKTAYMLLYNLQ